MLPTTLTPLNINKQKPVQKQSLTLRQKPHVTNSLNSGSLSRRTQGQYSNNNHSINRTTNVNSKGQSEIYFSKTIKYNYMKNIIDKYFQGEKKEIITSNNKTDKSRFYRMKQRTASKMIGMKKVNQTIDVNRYDRKDVVNQKQTHQRYVKLRKGNRMKLGIEKQDEQILHQEGHSAIDQIKLSNSIIFPLTSRYETLPIIDETFQQKPNTYEPELYQSQSISNIQTLISQSPKQQKILIRQNDIYYDYLCLVNGKPRYQIKKYKQIGLEIMKRQLKVEKIVKGKIDFIWKSSKYENDQIIYPLNKCLQDLLFKSKSQDKDHKLLTLRILPYNKKLTQNNCSQLKRTISQLLSSLSSLKPLQNNKIIPTNIYLNKYENWRLGQWGYSSYKQNYNIQNRQFQRRIQPILKSSKNWFVPPQYLAPQILQSIVGGVDVDLFYYEGASEIWSIGLCIFQVLSVIPVWMPQKCDIHGRKMQPRTGVLHCKDRDLKKILKKQQKLSYNARKIIDEGWKDEYDYKLLECLGMMLNYRPEYRPTYEEVINMLS